MWVLMVVLLSTSDPPSQHFGPSVVVQEFSSKANCENAKKFFDVFFQQKMKKIDEALRLARRAGKIEGIQDVEYEAECYEK